MSNDESVEVKIVGVSNLEKFIQRIKNIILTKTSENDNTDYQYFFRGENGFYQTSCLPNLFRYLDKDNGSVEHNNCGQNEIVKLKNNIEQDSYYKTLTLYPEEFVGLSNLDILCKMRHYEMTTRLLDVTSNPLVALYFAVSNLENKNGQSEKKEESDEDKLLTECNNYCYVYILKIKNAESLTFDSDKALLLSTLSKLNNEQLNLIYEYLIKRKKKDPDLQLKITPEFLKKPDDPDFDTSINEAFTKLIYECERERTALLNNHRLEVKHLLNTYHVYSRYTNPRIKAQSGSFILFGLDNQYKWLKNMNNTNNNTKKNNAINIDGTNENTTIDGIIKKCIKSNLSMCFNVTVIKIKKVDANKIKKELDVICNINDATMLKDTVNEFRYVKNLFLDK